MFLAQNLGPTAARALWSGKVFPAETIYFVTPRPFELEAPRAAGSRRAAFLDCAVCWLSLLAKVSRSCLRPLRSKSENSRVSIDEIARVSDGGVDQRRQARRFQR
jgi:hypothetical protein